MCTFYYCTYLCTVVAWAVPLGETVSSRLWWFYYGWRMCCICIYLFIRSILYAVCPNRPPLPQEGAIGGWWCALYQLKIV